MISGSLVALVTPMSQSGAIDWDGLVNLIEWHIENKTHAIVAVGTTGESATIDFEEHSKLNKFVVDQVAGRIPVIAGTGANSTSEAIELTRDAKQHGADACLLVTPYYNKPTQEGLYRHYLAIAEAVDIKQILYNVPGRTACDMLPDTVARLAKIDNIVGIKEASGELQRIKELMDLCGPDFAVYSGEDALAVDAMLGGAKGVISVTANVCPARMSQVCEAALNGETDLARELDSPLQALHRDLFVESNPIPVKWALAEMGRIQGAIRLPLTELAEPYHDTVRKALQLADAI